MSVKYVFILVGSLFISPLLISCNSQKEIHEKVFRPVRYQQITFFQGESERIYPGISRPGTEAKLSFRVAGKLVDFDMAIGETLARGQLVASLDNNDISLKYDRELAVLKNTEMQMGTANSNLMRVKSLYENNNVALGEYEIAKDKYTNAKTEFEAQRRAVDLRKRELSYYQLRSPIDGVVTSVTAVQNENVQAGQVLLSMQVVGDIKVHVGLPEQVISKVESGQSVQVNFPSIPLKKYAGKIIEVSYAADKSSSTFPITVTLNHADEYIRPGMTANVSFNFVSAHREHVLLIPIHAVSQEATGNYIYTVSPEGEGFGTVHQKNVMLGELRHNQFEVLRGLDEGEFLVTAGISYMNDGLKVRLIK